MMESGILISGMSGRFPSSDNISELRENLFENVDFQIQNGESKTSVNSYLDRRWNQLKDIDKFDCRFFGVHPDEVEQLDPQIRILLESTYECIVDAGCDPEVLRGENIGVFIGGSCSTDDDQSTSYSTEENLYISTGWSKSILATYTSFAFNFKGPSHVIDSGSSSGALALYEAVRSMQNNQCEAAIVGGSHLSRRSEIHDGKLLNGTGGTHDRSEAVATLFLQKSEVAKRQYGSVIYVKKHLQNIDVEKHSYLSAGEQMKMLRAAYKECHVNPSEVSYIETHGTGDAVEDSEEMSAISDVFCCRDRKKPLLVGCVKTNIGNSEHASGLCSIVNILLNMKTGLIPPSLYCFDSNKTKHLFGDQVKMVSESTPWEGGYAGVNCFGSRGMNVHAILKSADNEQCQIQNVDLSNPRLVVYNGTTKDSVQYFFKYIHSRSPNRDFYALLHGTVFSSIQAKPFRGYTLLLKDQQVEDIKEVTTDKRPVWYIFTGMGSQWPCMAKDLMHFDVFEKAIMRCDEALKPCGVDLTNLITDEKVFKSSSGNITSSLLAISSVQVALIDVLNALGLKPDGVIGHSLGEIACAYALGSITAEQVVMIAYYIGKTVSECPMEKGSMFSIGMSWSEAHKSCPTGVFPSCHNSENNATISGVTTNVRDYVDKLVADNVFAREVDACGVAFHCPLVQPMHETLVNNLKKVIPDPKPRSNRWISTSYPESRWNEPSAKLVDATYYANNLTSPVLFHEALQHVPKNAVVIEVAPHHLLQAILKRTFDSEAELVGLMKKNVDNRIHLLNSLGKLYTAGLNPNIEKLDSKIQFPVSRNTPSISPLIKWDHSECWDVAESDKYTSQVRMVFEMDVGADNSPHGYLLDYSVHGKCLYPATGYLVLAWRTLADFKDKEIASCPVVFENVKILRLVGLTRTERTKFLVCMSKKGGEFEIFESGRIVCCGRILSNSKTDRSTPVPYWEKYDDGIESTTSNAADIYNELKLKNFEYGPAFRGITGRNEKGDQGFLRPNEEWAVFLDSILQFAILSTSKKGLPNRIERVEIDPFVHEISLRNSNFKGVPIVQDHQQRSTRAGGVKLRGFSTSTLLYCQYLASLRS